MLCSTARCVTAYFIAHWPRSTISKREGVLATSTAASEVFTNSPDFEQQEPYHSRRESRFFAFELILNLTVFEWTEDFC